MAEHFLTKSQIALDQCLEFGGRRALDSYPALQLALGEKVSAEAAALFAEPLVSHGNDAAPASVAWYTEFSGEGKPLAALADDEQARIGAIVSRQLRGLRDVLADPEDGPLVGAALYVANDPGKDIWVVDGRPVIINWGMLPADVGRDLQARSRHYAATLGRFLPLSAPPPLSRSEAESRPGAGADSGRNRPSVAA